MDHQPVALGPALRAFRERAGLTREELAERSGLSAKGIAALERGERTHPYPHTMRCLAAALRLSAAELERLRSSVLPRSAGARPASPPAPLSQLLGRDHELAAAVDLLRPGGARLMTLIGPGGVGKTRLALAVAGEAAPLYADGAAAVWLASLTDAAAVIPHIAIALGLHDTAGRSLGEVLHGYLRNRSALLLLDNFEQVLGAAGDVVRLLEAAPDVSVLVTSRAPLRVRGEHVWRVGPLPVPVATRLFEERLAQDGPYMDGGAAPDPVSVSEICRRLDCLPLAVELAAARARVLGPAGVARRLDGALALLTDGARDGPPRHETLRRTIEWSYDLLKEDEPSVFRRLAVFSGGWTLGAAAVVVGVDPHAVLDAHTALLDGSLIARDASGEEPRFDMLQTVQAFAAEELGLAGEMTSTRDRHARYFRGLVLAGGAGHGNPRADWMDRITGDLANVQGSLRHLLAGGRVHDLTHMAFSLWPYWWIRGRLREGRRWVDEALRHPAARDPGDRARLHFVAGTLLYAQGAYEEAAARHGEGARLAREAGDLQALLWILTQQAHTAAVAAPTTASATLDAAEALRRQVDEPLAEPLIQMGRGLLALAGGRLAEGDGQLIECEARAADLGADWTLAIALDIHGMVAIGLGDPPRAEGLLRRALPIFGTLQDAWSTMYVLTTLADAAAIRSDGRRAARLFGAADALAERCGATILPFLPDLHRRCRERASAQIGPGAFALLRQESRAAPLDDMVAMALDG